MSNIRKNFIICLIIFGFCCFINSASAAENTASTTAQTTEKTVVIQKNKERYRIDYDAVCSNLLWYIPNVLLDLADCFSIEFGAGDVALDIDITKYASFGAGIGYSYNMGWANKRQIGFYKDANYNADLLCFSKFEHNRKNILGTYKNQNVINMSAADIINYPRSMRYEDPYAIGFKGAFMLGFKFQFHPVEFADFICELFFFDLNNDSRKEKVLHVIE